MSRRIQVTEDIEATIEAPEAMPDDFRAWLLSSLDVDGMDWAVTATEDAETEAGWPVTFTVSDVVDPATRVVTERRLHAFYRFHVDAAVAVARSADVDRFARLVPEMKQALLGVDHPRRTDAICSIADLWDGLEING
jgi:hypothetical protein